MPGRLVQVIMGGHVLGNALIMSQWYEGVFVKPAVKRFWELKINMDPRKMAVLQHFLCLL